jgi:hypothetical protein
MNATIADIQHKTSLWEVRDGCWVWTGYKNSKGYGQLSHHRVVYRAHRWFYELLVGEIPEGLELDHLCQNRACVNPDHLEPVTHLVNVGRGSRASQLLCKRGHGYMLRRGRRHCDKCYRAALLAKYYHISVEEELRKEKYSD